jgi:hypothetical protein
MLFGSFWMVVGPVSLIGPLASSMTGLAPNIQGSATAATLPLKDTVTLLLAFGSLPISLLRTLFKRFRQWFGVAINLND